MTKGAKPGLIKRDGLLQVSVWKNKAVIKDSGVEVVNYLCNLQRGIVKEDGSIVSFAIKGITTKELLPMANLLIETYNAILKDKTKKNITI